MFKNKSKLITLILLLFLMIGFSIIIDKNPDRTTIQLNSDSKAIDTIAVKTEVFDSLVRKVYNNQNQKYSLKFENKICSLTLDNIHDPTNVLNKDYEKLFKSSLDKDGFCVKHLDSNKLSILLVMQVSDGFVVVPSGLLLKVLNP